MLSPTAAKSYPTMFLFFTGIHGSALYMPASVPWGGLDAGVALGFCRGDLLSDPSGRLKKGNRKFVRSKIFLSEKEIEPRLLVSFLIEARDIDEKLQKK